MAKPLSTAYLRMQADRCQRLSRMCMDLGTARDLRQMADEYQSEASRIERASRQFERACGAQDRLTDDDDYAQADHKSSARTR